MFLQHWLGLEDKKMSSTFLDGFEFGLYKSTNGGSTFNRITDQ